MQTAKSKIPWTKTSLDAQVRQTWSVTEEFLEAQDGQIQELQNIIERPQTFWVLFSRSCTMSLEWILDKNPLIFPSWGGFLFEICQSPKFLTRPSLWRNSHQSLTHWVLKASNLFAGREIQFQPFCPMKGDGEGCRSTGERYMIAKKTQTWP